MPRLEALDRLLQLGAVSQALGLQSRALRRRQITLGRQPVDQGGDAAVAHVGFDRRAGREGGPAAAGGQSAIAHIARQQVLIADVGRRQTLEPVQQDVAGQGVAEAARQVHAVFLHFPQILDRLGPHLALGQDAAIGQGRRRRAQIGRGGIGGQAHEVEIVAGRQAVALGPGGDGVQGAHPLAGPYRPPAVHLIKGANVRLLGFRQARNLIVETVVEGGGRRRALDGNLLRPRSGGEGDRRRCDAQTQFPSIHNPSASRWPDPREPTPLFLLI